MLQNCRKNYTQGYYKIGQVYFFFLIREKKMNGTPSTPKTAQDLHSRTTVRTVTDEKLLKAA